MKKLNELYALIGAMSFDDLQQVASDIEKARSGTRILSTTPINAYHLQLVATKEKPMIKKEPKEIKEIMPVTYKQALADWKDWLKEVDPQLWPEHASVITQALTNMAKLEKAVPSKK